MQRRIDQDPVAHRHGFDPRAALQDLARHIHAGDVRKRETRKQRWALALKHVQPVESRRLYCNQHFSRTRLGVRNFYDLEDFNSPELLL
jgi:hypothetical protein